MLDWITSKWKDFLGNFGEPLGSGYDGEGDERPEPVFREEPTHTSGYGSGFSAAGSGSGYSERRETYVRKAMTSVPHATGPIAVSHRYDGGAAASLAGSGVKKTAASANSASSVTSLPTDRGNLRIVKPTQLADVPRYCEMIKAGETVVINTEGVSVDIAQRVLDSMSGVILMAGGDHGAISDRTYIFSPPGINITNELRSKAKEEDKRLGRLMGRA
jgi:FtsZ-interacting cell division protein YlmF